MTTHATTGHRTTGELILLWAMPLIWVFWVAAFLAFPGFAHPMSPTMTAQQVADFYFDPDNLRRIRYSMVVFNWFGVALIPLLVMIALQINRMAHKTPLFTYCFIGCIAGGPTLFCIADLFWLIAAFRPERSPELVLLFNDMAWITFTSQVTFLFSQNMFLAFAIYLDRQTRPIFPAWVAHFNIVTALAMAPAGFAAMHMTGPLAWDGLISFWIKNAAIAVWMVVMTLVLGKAIYSQREEVGLSA